MFLFLPIILLHNEHYNETGIIVSNYVVS